ncbi:cupin domain-containing protein [Halovenus sp. WSH3]|uniref:Cupin domain-containing protein n=1 Tax=Halovenus carboxidivorans TaxID=2692199 RepID=A0A6B0T200_9EURY|nr:cupin domain-containing protein [Halovenus carboxidivorans]MXR52258.1 cupin domain-containing protein [Halovenus carboxidivorans]
MPKTTIEAERAFDDEQFATSGVFQSDRMKVVCGYFEPGQFIPVHAPGSDVMIHIKSGTGVVREGPTEHEVSPGDIVVVPADTDRGIKADDDTRLEAVLVTAPPPTDEEHAPVRAGLRNDEFDPQ